MGAPDSLGSSPKYRQFTLSTGNDIDLNALGGPCRQILLLSAATGDLTIQPASPITAATPEALTITSLPAGTLLNVQATKIVGGLPNGLIVGVFW